MALFFESMQKCASNVLDTADIVRGGLLRHLPPITDFYDS